MWWLYQLSTPLNYLRIKVAPEGEWWRGKIVYDLILPLAISLISTFIFYMNKNHISLTSPEGMMADIKGLVQLLTAFFIAALAAVSTFHNENLEKNLSGTPATLKAWSNTEKIIKDFPLSRRQFVCYLFGYLSFISIFIYLFISVVQGFSTEIIGFLSSSAVTTNFGDVILPIRVLGVFGFSFVVSNLLTTTLLGLYFLSAGFHKLEE